MSIRCALESIMIDHSEKVEARCLSILYKSLPPKIQASIPVANWGVKSSSTQLKISTPRADSHEKSLAVFSSTIQITK